MWLKNRPRTPVQVFFDHNSEVKVFLEGGKGDFAHCPSGTTTKSTGLFERTCQIHSIEKIEQFSSDVTIISLAPRWFGFDC